jgi:hypothetical protein
MAANLPFVSPTGCGDVAWLTRQAAAKSRGHARGGKHLAGVTKVQIAAPSSATGADDGVRSGAGQMWWHC